MWVVDRGDRKIYAYYHPPSSNDTLSELTVSPKNIIGFEPRRNNYEVGVPSYLTQATVVTTRGDRRATLGFHRDNPDADPDAAGHQESLSPGRNLVWIRVISPDNSRARNYRLNINRSVTTEYGWKAVADFDGLHVDGNNNPRGAWTDGTTMWVADLDDDKIYAYNASDGTRDSAKDFDTLKAAGNEHPQEIWSNGTTMWVADGRDDKIYAYRMSNKTRDSAKDFNTLSAAGNNEPRGIWSNGTTMWVADQQDDKLYAYKMSDKTRDSAKDFNTLSAAGNNDPLGIWSNGTTMWVTDLSDDKLYAYKMSDKTRDEEKDFDTLSAAGNNDATGMWSNGTTMWVVDAVDDKIYAYNLTLDVVAAPSGLTANAVSTTRIDLSWSTVRLVDVARHELQDRGILGRYELVRAGNRPTDHQPYRSPDLFAHRSDREQYAPLPRGNGQLAGHERLQRSRDGNQRLICQQFRPGQLRLA